MINVKYISLVNLIANQEIVPELFADRFTLSQIISELGKILPGGEHRQTMLEGYQTVHMALGDEIASDNAARLMVSLLRKHRES